MLLGMGETQNQFLNSSWPTPPELLQAQSAFSSGRCAVGLKAMRKTLLFLILQLQILTLKSFMLS